MISINDFAKMIIDIFGKKLTIKNIPGPLWLNGRNSDNKLIKEFSEILLLNIHPNARKRLSFDDTKKRYKKLFS